MSGTGIDTTSLVLSDVQYGSADTQCPVLLDGSAGTDVLYCVRCAVPGGDQRDPRHAGRARGEGPQDGARGLKP
eukprot:2063889-Rhodomonas_salina.3